MEEGEFPHAPIVDSVEDKLLAIGKWTFNLGGLAHEFREILDGFRESLKHWADDRGPDPDSSERELGDLLASAAREGARRASIEIRGNYNESGSGNEQSWRTWIVVMLVVLSLEVLGCLIAIHSVDLHLDRLELEMKR